MRHENMAALHFDDYGGQPESGTLAALLNWAGALLSILLIAGLATWGWKLWVRDVSGVPVVRALEGPMRVAPADPGGIASEYQGLTVNRIAEERADDVLTEQVVLAPQPTTLDEGEDLAMAALPPVPVEVPAPVLDEAPLVISAAPQILDDAEILPLASEEGSVANPEISSLTIEDEDVAIAGASGGSEPTATDLAVALALGLKPEPAVQKIEAAAGVPTISPRPQVRPANLQLVSAAPTRDETGAIVAATIPSGTRLVQLGAYGSEEVAQVEWRNAMAQFGDYLAGKEPVVQEAKTGGRSFYRLRAAGFTDLADARRFCAVLVADGANCIPVVQE
ncbi:MAG: SPOR domain-containing protein [Silicimonas sp.]|nr:SPOR domain-containing protein [Silicimonas sp.]